MINNVWDQNSNKNYRMQEMNVMLVINLIFQFSMTCVGMLHMNLFFR